MPDINSSRMYYLLGFSEVLVQHGREGVAKKSRLHHGDWKETKQQYDFSLPSVSFYLSLLLGFQMALPTFRACPLSDFSRHSLIDTQHTRGTLYLVSWLLL